MFIEMEYLDKKEACDPMEFLARRKNIGSRWVFKKEMNAKGRVEK